MPGTVGSLWGLLIAWCFQRMSWPLPVHVAVLVGLAVLGIPICGRAARSFGSRDPGKIVYDEFVALPWVFLAVPIDLVTGLIGFLLFRLFDIAKPWPVRRFEQLPGGLGIMADDMAAAAYSAAALWLIARGSGMSWS
jgi:phosphatidylglycerophosphatase A